MDDITKRMIKTGKLLKDDGTPVNAAEMIEALHNALVANKNAGVQVTGSNIVEEKTEVNADVNKVITFSEPITSIEIYHEETTWQEFVINGITLTYPAGWHRSPVGGTPSVEVTIPSISCIVRRLV